MKLLRKQPGLPFLMALGVLLILSASFLAVQLWSDGNVRRGAAQALEAPVMPMALDAKKNGKPKKAIKPVKKLPDEEQKAPELPVVEHDPVLDDDSSVELPDVVLAEPKIEQKAGTVVEKTLSEAKTEVKSEKKADLKAVTSNAGPEKNELKADSDVIKAKPVQKVVKKAVAPKTSRSSRKAKLVEEEEDITVVPPEWNWFSTPLRAELKHGQVEIVPAVAPIDLKLVSVAAKTVDSTGSAVVRAQSTVVEGGYESEKKVAAPAMDSHKPFAKALERMAKIRRIREAREQQTAVKMEEARQITVVDEVSPSMKKLGETLRNLSEKLEKSSVVPVSSEAMAPSLMPVKEGFEEAPPVVATGGSESLESDAINSQLQPYYSGSGSSFSNRVNELIKKGAWLKE